MKLTVREIDLEIEGLLVASKALALEKSGGDWAHSDPHYREIERLEKIKEVMGETEDWEHYGEGTIIIADKFILSLRSGKWRIKGKSKYYRGGSNTKNFFNNYVNKELTTS